MDAKTRPPSQIASSQVTGAVLTAGNPSLPFAWILVRPCSWAVMEARIWGFLAF